MMIRVQGAETVEMIALFLIFATLQICQIVDLIHIIKAAPVAGKAEAVGIILLQGINIVLIQTGDAAGNATLLGIC